MGTLAETGWEKRWGRCVKAGVGPDELVFGLSGIGGVAKR